VAFAVAVKHHVRGEFGTDYEDLHDLLPKNFASDCGYGFGSIENELDRTRTPKSSSSTNPPRDSNDSTEPMSEALERDSIVFLQNEFKQPSIPLPIIIIHALGLLLSKWKLKGAFDALGPAGFNNVHTMLNSLTNEMGAVERLGSLPIPVVYGVHLKQVVTLFLFCLPFTLVEALSWRMVPFVTVYAFILIGIEAIASEIESPLGYDNSDLPLDLVCAELLNEIEHFIARLPEKPSQAGTLFAPAADTGILI